VQSTLACRHADPQREDRAMTEKSCPHCGGSLESGRSLPDHRRFFALIQAAFHQWKENHEFQPDNSEHLRAWLLCKAGYRTNTVIEPPSSMDEIAYYDFVASVEGVMRAMDGHGFVVMHDGVVVIVRPKSIAWHKIGQREFGRLRDAVTDIIEAEIGVSADQLLRERDNAA
jgi:hypothetical protein